MTVDIPFANTASAWIAFQALQNEQVLRGAPSNAMLKHFQEKCVAVFRAEMLKNKELERLSVSVKQ